MKEQISKFVAIKFIYHMLTEMQNELYDLIGLEAVRTFAYRPAYGPSNALT